MKKKEIISGCNPMRGRPFNKDGHHYLILLKSFKWTERFLKAGGIKKG
jgi:hypothetical protein